MMRAAAPAPTLQPRQQQHDTKGQEWPRAVGGGAYVAGRRGARRGRQEAEPNQRIAESEGAQGGAAAAPTSGGGLSPDAMARLKERGDLHNQGILTDEEFAQQKQRVLE